MLPDRNTLAAWLGLCAVLLLAPVGLAQNAAQAPELAFEDGEAAFNWVQGWVRSEKGVPDDADLPDRPVTGVFGVYVTLREEGRILGRGQALRNDADQSIDQPGPAVQLAPLLAAATRQALDELRDKEMKRAIELDIADPDLFKQGLMAKRQRVQLDIQIGHSLESIVLPIDAEDAALLTTFAPGFHGLRMAGNLAGKADYAWPATELARNTPPLQLLFRLLDQQGYGPDVLPRVARGDGPSLQRFTVLHLVRPGPAQPMRQLIRGNLIVQQQVIDKRTLEGLAERTARFLDQLIVTDLAGQKLRVRGAYEPSRDRYDPKWSQERQAALLAYALMRHARIRFDEDNAGESMRSRALRVLRLVEQLEPEALPEPGKPRHLTAALMLMALCESPIDLEPAQIQLRQRLGKALVDLHHPEGGGYRVMAGADERLSRENAAVVTAALAAWYEQTRDRALIQPVWAVLTDLMKENNRQARVIDLLWVGHALAKAGPILAKNHPQPDTAAGDLAAWKQTLADNLALLSEQQIRSKPALGPDDVAGGFILTPAPPGSPPNPTWQSAMPLTIIALGLRDPDIVPPDSLFGPLLTAQLGARFLGQLMITQPSAYYLRDIEPALGGVRNTLWDNTLYPDSASMTLLAFTELQQTLTALEPKDDNP